MRRSDGQSMAFRHPTETECKWIKQLWLPEIERRKVGVGEKVSRYAGIFLVSVGAVTAIRKETDVVGVIVMLILAFICFAFSTAAQRSIKERERFIYGLEQGMFRVAPAFTYSIRFANVRNSNTKALAQVCMLDGRRLKGVYKIPRKCAVPLIRQGIHQIPILLIQTEGYSHLMVVPQP